MSDSQSLSILIEPSIPKAVEDNSTKGAEDIWNFITDGKQVSGTYKQSDIAEAVNVSVRTVRRALKGFERCNLIKLYSYQGQGRGVRIVNLWLKGWKKVKEKVHRALDHAKEREYLKDNWNRNGTRKTDDRDSPTWSDRLDCLGICDKEKTYIDKNRVFINPKDLKSVAVEVKERFKSRLNQSFWSHSSLKDLIMSLVRKILWKLGQDERTDDRARQDNQVVCNAIGRVFKVRDLPLQKAVRLLRKLVKNPKQLFDYLSDTFGDLMQKIMNMLGIGCVKVYCMAEDGTEFTSAEYDSETEALNAKAEHNHDKKSTKIEDGQEYEYTEDWGWIPTADSAGYDSEIEVLNAKAKQNKRPTKIESGREYEYTEDWGWVPTDG